MSLTGETPAFASQVCYTDENLETLRRIRRERRRTKTSDPAAYADWTKQEEAIHDAAFEIYETARMIPKAKLADGIRESRAPFCPPVIPPEAPTETHMQAALSAAVRNTDDLFRGVGSDSAPWRSNEPLPLPPPPLPSPWSPNKTPHRKAVRKVR